MKRLLILAGMAFAALPSQATASSNLSVSLLENCEGTQAEAAGVGAIFGKIVVSSVVDWAGAMIKAQSVARTESLGASSTEGRFFTLSSDGSVKRSYGCLRLISWSQGAEGARTQNGLNAITHLNTFQDGTPVTRVPDFAAEFHITGPQDLTGVFALRPRFVYFGRSNISGWTNNKRSLAVALTFKNPSTPDAPFASASFRFEQIPTDTLITMVSNPLIYNQSSGWMSAPPFTASEADVVASAALFVAAERANAQTGRMGKALQKEMLSPLATMNAVVLTALKEYCSAAGNGAKETGAKVDVAQCKPGFWESEVQLSGLKSRLERAKTAYLVPPLPLQEVQAGELGLMTVDAIVTETRDPSAFWTAVSGAFDAQKDDLGTALRQKLIPSERKAAEKAELDASIIAANARDETKAAFEDAKLTVVEKEEIVKKLTDKSTALEVATAKTELVKARLKANTAARSSGQPLPYPGLDV